MVGMRRRFRVEPGIVRRRGVGTRGGTDANNSFRMVVTAETH